MVAYVLAVSKKWCNLSQRSWGNVKTLRTAAVSAEFKTRKQKRLSGDILASLMSRITPALTCLDISGYQTREELLSMDLFNAFGKYVHSVAMCTLCSISLLLIM